MASSVVEFSISPVLPSLINLSADGVNVCKVQNKFHMWLFPLYEEQKKLLSAPGKQTLRYPDIDVCQHRLGFPGKTSINNVNCKLMICCCSHLMLKICSDMRFLQKMQPTYTLIKYYLMKTDFCWSTKSIRQGLSHQNFFYVKIILLWQFQCWLMLTQDFWCWFADDVLIFKLSMGYLGTGTHSCESPIPHFFLSIPHRKFAKLNTHDESKNLKCRRFTP